MVHEVARMRERDGVSCLMLPSDGAALERASALLRGGELVAFPTETVYGLGGDAGNDAAVARIFAAKGRPAENPLIAHFADFEGAAREVEFDDRARRLAELVWPGPLTLVLRRRPESRISLRVSAGFDTLAVRVPDHPLALALLRRTGCPLAAPSANPSGGLSPTRADHVMEHMADKIDMVLDGGPCRLGIESTVVDLSRPDQARLLRPGGYPAEAIATVVGTLSGADGPILSPGIFGVHYAPRLPLRRNARRRQTGEALLAFGRGAPKSGPAVRNLSSKGDLAEAAANLFDMLHALDQPEFIGIAVMPIPDTGIGVAINDRLRRAETSS